MICEADYCGSVSPNTCISGVFVDTGVRVPVPAQRVRRPGRCSTGQQSSIQFGDRLIIAVYEFPAFNIQLASPKNNNNTLLWRASTLMLSASLLIVM